MVNEGESKSTHEAVLQPVEKCSLREGALHQCPRHKALEGETPDCQGMAPTYKWLSLPSMSTFAGSTVVPAEGPFVL
jgi:hypothetical protein